MFLTDVEKDINRELLFKQGWQRCVTLGETWPQKVQQSLYGLNNTNPLGNGLGGHYLTVGFNFAANIGVKAGCDFLFAKLIQLELGVNLVGQTCNDWLDSLGLTPPTAVTAGSGGSAGGCSSGAGGGGGVGGGGSATSTSASTTSTSSTASYFSTPSQVAATTNCQHYTSPGVNSLCSCTNEISFSEITYGDVCSDALEIEMGGGCAANQVFQLQEAVQFNTGNSCDGSVAGCDYLSYNYTWSCCKCPDGFLSHSEGACHETGVDTCIGCPDPGTGLVGDAAVGWSCVTLGT